MNPLHPSIRSVWRIRYALWSLLLLAGAAIRDIIGLLGRGESFPPPGVLTALVLVVGLLAVILVPRLQYRYWRYELSAEELFLERGVLTRVRTVVPLRRIQHLDVSQSVLEREFELGRLIVHTAGTRASTVALPGLHIDDANRLYDQVKTYVVDDAL